MKKLLSIFMMVSLVFLLVACGRDPIDDTQDPDDNNNDNDSIDLTAVFPNHRNYYQLFVRSFADSNGDGVGDFNGIKENLDYFEALGIEGIWLMPIHPTNSKHGYDVKDFYAVNEEYGTMEDFEQLLDEANARGIKIIIDYVLNHTAEDHPWFQAFLRGEEPYNNYYRRIDANDDRYGSRGSWGQDIWHSMGNGYYYAGYFGGYMPDLNWSNEAVQDEMLNVAEFWMEKGVGGFRLDAAMHLQARNEIPAHYQSPLEETLWQLNYFEFRLKERFPEAYIVGEIWDQFAVYNQFYRSMDAPLHFDFGHHVVNTVNRGFNDNYANQILQWHNQAHWMMEDHGTTGIEAPFLRNHDQPRIASGSIAGTQNLGNSHSKLRLAAEMLLTVPGNPYLYYGEELGMMGEAHGAAPIWDESIRLPMLFDNTYKATWPEDDWGYTDPFNQNVAPVSVQQNDPDSLFNVYARLLNLRNASPALKYGTIELFEDNNAYLQGFYRVFEYEDVRDVVLVLHNIDSDTYPMYDYVFEGEMVYYTEHTHEGEMAARSTMIIQLSSDAIEAYFNE